MNTWTLLTIIIVIVVISIILWKYFNKQKSEKIGSDKGQDCSEVVSQLSDVVADTFNKNWSSISKQLNVEPLNKIIPLYTNPYEKNNRLYLFNADLNRADSPVRAGYTNIRNPREPNTTCMMLDPGTSMFAPRMRGTQSFAEIGNITQMMGLSGLKLEKSDAVLGDKSTARFNVYLHDVFQVKIDRFAIQVVCNSMSPGGIMPDPVKTSYGVVEDIVVKLKQKDISKPLCSVDIKYNFKNRNEPYLNFNNIIWGVDRNIEVIDRDWVGVKGFLKTVTIVNSLISTITDQFGKRQDLVLQQLQENIDNVRNLISRPILQALNSVTNIDLFKEHINQVCQFKYIISPEDLKSCSSIFSNVVPQLFQNMISNIYNNPINIGKYFKITKEGDVPKETVCFNEAITGVLCTLVRKRPTVCSGAKYSIKLDNISGLDKITTSQSISTNTSDELINTSVDFFINDPIEITIKDAYIVLFCKCPEGPAGFSCSDEAKYKDWFFGYNQVKCSFTFTPDISLMNISVGMDNEGDINVTNINWNDNNPPVVKITETTTGTNLPDWISEPGNDITKNIEDNPVFFSFIEYIIKLTIFPEMQKILTEQIETYINNLVLESTPFELLKKCLTK